MSHQTLDILFGVTGQSLYFDAPEGRPSSVTTSSVFETTVGDDGTAESATTGSAAVETTPNTTFNAASGDGQADPRKCNLTATTGCAIGRRYLAKNALGETEFVEVTGISSGVYVQARQPLQNAYTTADTFAPNPRYRWRLVYVVSSVTYIHDAYLDLVRYAARYDVTGLDVERRFGGWLRVVGTFEREDQGASVIAEAFQRVKFDLYNLGVADQSVRNREVVNELVKFCAGAMVFDDEQHWKLYQDRLSQLVAWGKTNLATDSSGASGPADVRPLWRR